MKKYLVTLLALLLVLSFTFLAACAPKQGGEEEPTGSESAGPAESGKETDPEPEPAKKIRVAAIFPGSIQDMGWNQSGYESLMQLKDEGFEVSFQENVDMSALKDVIRSYASEGYDLVIGHDFFHTDPVIEVAPEFPDTMFGVVGGTHAEGNVVTVGGTNWEGAYLAGAFAGLTTKTNKIGLINTADGDVARRMRNAFELGAREYNPDVVALHTFTGSWDDSVKAKELAIAMAKDGVDIILTQTGQANVGAVEGCQEAGIFAIGAPNDFSEIAPETIMATSYIPSGAQLYYLAHLFADGTLEGKFYELGVKEGAEDIIIHHDFPQDIIDKVMKVRQDLADKKIDRPSGD